MTIIAPFFAKDDENVTIMRINDTFSRGPAGPRPSASNLKKVSLLHIMWYFFKIVILIINGVSSNMNLV